MKRTVLPEILDSLPYDHKDAIRNRSEIRRLNAFMGNYRWLERQVRKLSGDQPRVLEIGAGAGDFARHLSNRGVRVQLDGMDLCPPPSDWNADCRWWREDLNTFEGYAQYHAVVANLILHQFNDAALARVGSRLNRQAQVIIASEPARQRHFLWGFKVLCKLFRFGAVSRHDGAVSIRAGFVKEELPELLGLDRNRWRWKCRTGLRGQYQMVAWTV